MWWNVLCDADRNGANRRAQIIENVICQLRRIRGRQTYITLHLYSERVWKNQFRALNLMRKCEKKFGDQRGPGFCCCCWLKSRALIQHDSQRKTPVAWSLTDYWLPFSSHQTEQNSKNRTNNRQESYPTVPTKQPHNECAERPHVMEYMGQPSVTMTMLMIISDVCDQRQRGDWLFFRLSRSHALLLYSVIIVDNTINEQPNHEWDKSKATKQSTIFRRHFLLRFFV